MGLLGEIYSTIDSKKRQLKGLLADPVETIRQGFLNFRDDQNKLLNDFGVGYQTPGYKSVLTSPEQVKAARQSVADWGANQGIGAATVWHGSPHKFNKFDSSKIGTGEGAQAYGHGLYLAENKGVAGAYKRAGETAAPIQYQGEGILNWALGNRDAVKALPPVTQKTLAYARDFSSVDEATRMAKMADMPEVVSEIDRLVKLGALKNGPEGNLYKVDLPDEAIAKMLDIDKPLTSSSYADDLAELYGEAGKVRHYVDVNGNKRLMVMGQDGRSQQSFISPTDAKKFVLENFNVFDVYSALAEKNGAAKAAEILSAKGIPGIRYLDGGSRGAGQGTSNYVIFPGNENLLTILERNGQPVGLLD